MSQNAQKSRSQKQAPKSRILGSLIAFFQLEAASGIVLLSCAVLALLWANSPLEPAYQMLKHFYVLPGFSVEHFVNDVLMAVFFLMMGLEIKRELMNGELSTPRQAALPIAGALGGMLVPALIFLLWNPSGPANDAWGVPMATDIAFALGVMTVLGKRVPLGLKVFLVALAIIDDLGAILVIAFFYSGNLSGGWLLIAGVITTIMAFLNRRGVTKAWPYLVGGAALWVAVFQSGIHATIAGVLMAFCIPHKPGPGKDHQPLLNRMEHVLHPWVAYAILPLFAIINAGVTLSPEVVGTLTEPLGMGIVMGLLVGKPLGIALFAWLAVRFGLAALPSGTAWPRVIGAGLLGGIGFTMSLFIAGLGLPADLLDGAKLAVLVASVTAGLLGYTVLRLQAKEKVRKKAA